MLYLALGAFRMKDIRHISRRGIFINFCDSGFNDLALDAFRMEVIHRSLLYLALGAFRIRDIHSFMLYVALGG